MSYIDIEENENEYELQILSKSEVDIPRSKLSAYFNDEIKEVNSIKFKFTTELQPTLSQIDLTNNEAKTPKCMYNKGISIIRSLSLSKLNFVQNSPLMCFKKSAHINNISSVNRLASISPLMSKRSGNCKPKLSTRVNILKLSIKAPNKRKLTSNQITDVIKPKLFGDTIRQCKNNFATQIIKQTIREVDEENNFNDNDNDNDINDNISQNQYVINIIQPQKSSIIEFENIKKQIIQTAKCVYTKTFSAFCGFAAFTFKTNEETFLDKMDIVLNKELHHNSTPNDLCHCFGLFPCVDNNKHISSMFKERFHTHLLHRKDIAFNPVNAFFDTLIHFNKKLITTDNNTNNNNNSNTSSKQNNTTTTTNIPPLLSLLIMNNHIYIANNSSSKCLCFNIDNMNISSLTKTQTLTSLSAIKDEITEKKQQLQFNSNILSQTTLKSISFHSPQNNNIYEPIVTELSLNNLQQQDTIDFIVVVNENIASVLTNKEIILAIITSLLSNTLSYERTLETAIDSICVEAAKKHAKFPLSVVFLPMKGYYSLVSGTQKETYINNILQKLKTQLVNEDTLHNQCVVYKDHRNGRKTSAITVHNHVRCKLSSNDVRECKENDVSSSFNSSYSKSRSWVSSAYKEGERCNKKGKRFFCGCFA